MSAQIIEPKFLKVEQPLSRQEAARRRLKACAEYFAQLAKDEWAKRWENLR